MKKEMGKKDELILDLFNCIVMRCALLKGEVDIEKLPPRVRLEILLVIIIKAKHQDILKEICPIAYDEVEKFTETLKIESN